MAPLLAAAWLAGCDSDAVDPAENGQVSAVLTDAPAAAAAPMAAAADNIAGSLTGSATVEIATDTGDWISLGDPVAVDLALQANAAADALYTGASVPAGTYTRVRVTLSSAEATLLAGSVVGGIALGGDAFITVGGTDGRVAIEKTVPAFGVLAGANTAVTVDLNAESWLTVQAVTALVAGDAEVAAAAAASVVVSPE
ncbi:MAG: DUF4382 domain-containing protein [Gemmatimonadales bacterium]